MFSIDRNRRLSKLILRINRDYRIANTIDILFHATRIRRDDQIAATFTGYVRRLTVVSVS